jgi:predicted metalloprotease with PDZ domain
VSTWAGYDTPVAFGISYYAQGQNLGALLDLSIRQDTNGASSLDDVMRALFNEHYKKGRGFTTEDMISIVNRLTKRDYHDFYNKYVFGTDVPDYDRIFGYAGYRLEKKTEQAPVLGFNGRFRSGGLTVNSVEPASGAAVAGLKVGDVVTKIDGKPLQAVAFNTLANRTVPLTITRGGEEMQINVAVGSRPVMNYALTAVANPTAQQMKIREG